MKYWDCINVPGKTDVEGAKTSAPSLADTTGLSVVDVEPDMKEAVKKAVEEARPSRIVVNNENANELSDEYKQIFNQAFNKGEVKVDPIPGTDAVSVSVPADLPVTTEKTPEEIDALKYVSSDDVDVSDYDIDADFETSDEETITDTEHITPENSEDVPEKSFDKNALLESIFSNGGEGFATSIAEKVAEKVVEPPEPQEPEYALDEEKYGEIIDTLNKYEEEYFKEIPIKHISNRFLRNISKAVFRAHEDATIKYDDPPIMDPIFLLYPLTTEDPYMAMGKFWSIVTEKISNNRSWTSAISKSVEEYEEYMRMEAEEEDDEADEVDGVESNNE